MQDSLRRKLEFESALTNDTYRRAWRYAWYLCADYHAAQDLLQDALAQAFLRFHQINDVQLFRGWLLSIVRSSFLMDRRKAESRHRRGRRVLEPSQDSCAVSPDATSGFTGLPPELVAALLRLPAGQREVLELYYLHELDLNEIAKLLGISRSNAKIRLFRGRNAFRLDVKTDSVAGECCVGEKP